MFGALAFSNWWTNRDELRAGSKVVSRGGEALAIDHIPTSYRAVYRFENRARGELVVTTEKVWVRRPFASRVENWKGAPPGTTRESLRFSAFGVFATSSRGSAAPLNIAAPPGLSSGDLRVDAVLDEAVETKTMLRRERREVYGRQCQVYRVGGPVLAGDIEGYEPGRGTYTDVCVDRNGLVVEEYWVDEGDLLRRRVATEVDIDPPLDRDLFEVVVPENPDVDRGAVGRIDVDPSQDGRPLWTFADEPKGFERLGHYAVVRSSQSVPQMSGGLPSVPLTSTSEVFVRGPDVLVIDQDPSLGQLVNLENRTTRDVDAAPLEDAKLILDARMSEVRGQAPDGSVVRVFGTMPTDELVELARGLEPLED